MASSPRLQTAPRRSATSECPRTVSNGPCYANGRKLTTCPSFSGLAATGNRLIRPSWGTPHCRAHERSSLDQSPPTSPQADNSDSLLKCHWSGDHAPTINANPGSGLCRQHQAERQEPSYGPIGRRCNIPNGIHRQKAEYAQLPLRASARRRVSRRCSARGGPHRPRAPWLRPRAPCSSAPWRQPCCPACSTPFPGDIGKPAP